MTWQKWFKALRVIVALCFFIGFLLIFSDVKGKLPAGIYDLIIHFQFLPSFLAFAGFTGLLLSGFFIVLLLAMLLGRAYCSVLCPLGIMQDIMLYLRKKLIPFKKKTRFTKPHNLLRYSILLVFFIFLLFAKVLSVNVLDPYSNFGRIASSIYQPVFIIINNLISKGLNLIGIFTIQPLASKNFHLFSFCFAFGVFSLILALVYFRGRLYCNTVCPVGTILGLVSKISLFKIKIDSTSCTKCGKCQLVCKAHCIDLKTNRIDETRCVSCCNCIRTCEESSIGYQLMRVKSSDISKHTSDQKKRDFIKKSLLILSVFPLNSFAVRPVAATPKSFQTRGPSSPPGSISISHLIEKCIGCQLCISSCPTKVLQPSFLEYGITGIMLPRMDNQSGFCNYECTKCSEVCPTGALLPLKINEKKTTQLGIAVFVPMHCVVTTEGNSCGSCSEHCPTQAVHMIPYTNGLTIPEVTSEICIGCGACEHVCPVTIPSPAIYVVPHSIHKKAKLPEAESLQLNTKEDFPF